MKLLLVLLVLALLGGSIACHDHDRRHDALPSVIRCDDEPHGAGSKGCDDPCDDVHDHSGRGCDEA